MTCVVGLDSSNPFERLNSPQPFRGSKQMASERSA
jgi:hypothetical protein